MRVDKWLWAARFFKTRTLATDAINGGKVQVNGARIKPARELKIDERLDIRNTEEHWEVIVKALSDKRGPASDARQLYEETETSVKNRQAQRDNRKLQADPAADLACRPTKRDRRQLNRCGDLT